MGASCFNNKKGKKHSWGWVISTKAKGITSSSTAEYFSKNLQQVGFSSPTKAVLTTLKEAVDNSLDACEENGIAPDIHVTIEKLGPGAMKNTDRVMVRVEDNGPGIPAADLPKVFGEYLASSKFGRGRCSRGQQGIGISAATTWAMQTTATGVKVISKTKNQKKAVQCRVEVDLKKNQGIVKDKTEVEWNRPHGTSVEFVIDGRIQLNGEGGLLNFLKGNTLVNPHLKLSYTLPETGEVTVERVSDKVPEIPEATSPHPHTMKLGEFMAHSAMFLGSKVREWLKKGFSRVADNVLDELAKRPEIGKALLEKTVKQLTDKEMHALFSAIQHVEIQAPSTRSVLTVGEESLAKSIYRIGDVDFFAVMSRKPTICDFKPVSVEVAIARLKDKPASEEEETAQVLRFANRVPLQFDKAGCAIVKAITSVNWKTYGLRQPSNGVPLGPYIMAVSVVSPFIKFKNASKETIEASDELVEELRRALMQAGQRLSRHIRKEHREAELESKIQHIEKFAPILVEALCRITKASAETKDNAESGLLKILGRDAKEAKAELSEAKEQLSKHLAARRKRLGEDDESEAEGEYETEDDSVEEELPVKGKKKKAKVPPAKPAAKSAPAKKAKAEVKPAPAKKAKAPAKPAPAKKAKPVAKPVAPKKAAKPVKKSPAKPAKKGKK